MTQRATVRKYILTFSTVIMAVVAFGIGTTAEAATPTVCTDPSFINSRTPGFYGQYFNLAEGDPGMETYSGPWVSNSTVGDDNPWYNPKYFVFGRVDKSINFGSHFLPLNTRKKGDPYFFAVHWRAVVSVPTSGSYHFAMTSDDDSWLLIDNDIDIDLNGLHPAQKGSADVTLTAGDHVLDIYYAERTGSGAVFSFSADKQLSFFALPPGCPVPTSASPIITTRATTSVPVGRVLGASTSITPYTPAVALYKTTASPAVYAILTNGERHYISGPTAFARYGYSLSKVQVVSHATLNKYPETRLVRAPENSTVYLLSPRSNGQWLKIAVLTPTAFISYDQNEWGNVSVVDQADIDAYPNAILIRAQGSSDTYLLQHGQRRLFLSSDVLLELGYSQYEVMSVTPAHLESFSLGDPIG